jgi:lactoylglutathione lyase
LGIVRHSCIQADRDSGHIGLTVPDVKAALVRFEKLGVEVFKPLGVASNETIPVPEGLPTIVPGYAAVYKQIAMIRVCMWLHHF